MIFCPTLLIYSLITGSLIISYAWNTASRNSTDSSSSSFIVREDAISGVMKPQKKIRAAVVAAISFLNLHMGVFNVIINGFDLFYIFEIINF